MAGASAADAGLNLSASSRSRPAWRPTVARRTAARWPCSRLALLTNSETITCRKAVFQACTDSTWRATASSSACFAASCLPCRKQSTLPSLSALLWFSLRQCRACATATSSPSPASSISGEVELASGEVELTEGEVELGQTQGQPRSALDTHTDTMPRCQTTCTCSESCTSTIGINRYKHRRHHRPSTSGTNHAPAPQTQHQHIHAKRRLMIST